MVVSKYNLRSSVRDHVDSTNSGETIQPEQHNPDLFVSQVTNQTPQAEEVIGAGGNESMETSGTPTREEQNTADGKPSGVRLYGKVIETDMLQDVIASFRVVKGVPPPPVPLCRLLVNEAIRTIQDNITELGTKFRTMGYLRELGTFFVSLKKAGESEHEVDQYDLEDWGPVWREVNMEFEEDLRKVPE